MDWKIWVCGKTQFLIELSSLGFRLLSEKKYKSFQVLNIVKDIYNNPIKAGKCE